MRQKDIRTRVAEIEAETKAPDLKRLGIEAEDEKPFNIVPIITGLVMAGISVYILMAILPELIKEIK